MSDSDLPDPCEIVPFCPICLVAPLKHARRLKDMDICLSEHCGTSLTVPHEAWRIRRGDAK
jgi:hypothetical protein